MSEPQDLSLMQIFDRVRAVAEALQFFIETYVRRAKAGWKARVARRKGWLSDAIDFREDAGRADFRSFLLDTGKDPRVNYSDVYERGRRKINYPGRFALSQTLEQLDTQIEGDIDRLVENRLR